MNKKLEKGNLALILITLWTVNTISENLHFEFKMAAYFL